MNKSEKNTVGINIAESLKKFGKGSRKIIGAGIVGVGLLFGPSGCAEQPPEPPAAAGEPGPGIDQGSQTGSSAVTPETGSSAEVTEAGDSNLDKFRGTVNDEMIKWGEQVIETVKKNSTQSGDKNIYVEFINAVPEGLRYMIHYDDRDGKRINEGPYWSSPSGADDPFSAENTAGGDGSSSTSVGNGETAGDSSQFESYEQIVKEIAQERDNYGLTQDEYEYAKKFWTSEKEFNDKNGWSDTTPSFDGQYVINAIDMARGQK